MIVNPSRVTIVRDEVWLNNQLDEIWQTHFHDVGRLNTVTISWGRKSRTRLGTISGQGGKNPRTNPEISMIRVNPLLQQPEVPQSVVWQTIAHELAHYTHGFCSPHPQKYPHPHKGNVIGKELLARNLGTIYHEAQAWLKVNWAPYVAASLGTKPRRRKTYGKRRRMSLLSHIKKTIVRRRRLGK